MKAWNGEIPEGWEINPNDPTKLIRSRTTKTPEERAAEEREKLQAKINNEKQEALLNIQGSDLAHNNGFDVTFGGSYGTPANRVHYDYIGALANSRGKWRYGAIGDDVPGHGWGFQSSSNVESIWGNFSAEGSSSKEKMRVLSPAEVNYAISSNAGLLDALEEQLRAAGYDEETDFQLIEVPNEDDSNKKGYLIAVQK